MRVLDLDIIVVQESVKVALNDIESVEDCVWLADRDRCWAERLTLNV